MLLCAQKREQVFMHDSFDTGLQLELLMNKNDDNTICNMIEAKWLQKQILKDKEGSRCSSVLTNTLSS